MKRVLVSAVLALSTLTVFAKVNVDILFVFDKSGKAWLEAQSPVIASADFAKVQLDRLNEVVKNSSLDDAFTFTSAGVVQTDVDFGGQDFFSVLTEDNLTNGDNWAAVKKLRENAKADLTVVLTTKPESSRHVGHSFSLIPYVNGERKYGLDSSWVSAYMKYFGNLAYAICDIETVSKDNNYTLVHEVGHLMGTGHSELVNGYEDPGLSEFSQAYMYEDAVDGNRYSTVTGYGFDYLGNSGYEILPYFSSPDLVNPKTGTALGDAQHNNVATLRTTCGYVAALRKREAASEDSADNSSTNNNSSDTNSKDNNTTDNNVALNFKKAVLMYGSLWDGQELVGCVQLKVGKTDKKGKSKLAGTVVTVNGRKCAIKAAGKTDMSGLSVTESLTVKNLGTMEIELTQESFSGTLGSMTIKSMTGEALEGNGRFVFSGEAPTQLPNGATLIDSLLPSGCVVSLSGSWYLPKAGKVKLDKLTGEVVVVGENPSALKLKYTAKTCSFKGSFKFYAIEGGKLKKYTANVTGLAVDGQIRGYYLVKKLGNSGYFTIEK